MKTAVTVMTLIGLGIGLFFGIQDRSVVSAIWLMAVFGGLFYGVAVYAGLVLQALGEMLPSRHHP